MVVSDRVRLLACRLIEEALEAVGNGGDVFHCFGVDECGPTGPAVLLAVRSEDVPAIIDVLTERHGDCEGLYSSHSNIFPPR